MIEKKLHILGAYLVDQLRKELEAQGHVNTGELAASLRYEIKRQQSAYRLIFWAKDYGKYVNFGIRPGKWVSIAALAEWVEQRGIASGEKNIKNAAFAIRNAIFKQGSPTSGAFEFTKNGRRTEFVDFIFKEKEPFIQSELLSIFSQDFVSSLDNVLQQNRSLYLKTE